MNTVAPPNSAPAQRRRSWPLIVCVLFIVIAVTLQLTDLSDVPGGPIIRMLSDRAAVNVCTLGSCVIAGSSFLLWFFLWSGVAKIVRVLTAFFLVAAVALLATCVRVEAVRGDLRPEFRWRWSKSPDRELAPVEIPREAVEPKVDLSPTSPDDFPQFLGPYRSLHAGDRGLLRDWAANPPKLLWQKRIGAGWSSFAAVNGFAVTQEQRGDEELVSCYDIETGEILWTNAIAARHETVPGYVGPRATPTIYEGDVYTLGATGVLQRIEGATGKTVWSVDLLAMQNSDLAQESESISWGRSASPLVIGNMVVVPVGGPKSGKKVSLAAFDRTSGEVKWTSGERQASYASPVLARIADRPMILSVNEDTASGHDPATGKVLWEHSFPGSSTGNASCSQPIAVGADGVLLSKGYGEGARLLRITAPKTPDGEFSVEIAWQNQRALRTKFTNVVCSSRFAYGLSDGILQCVNLSTGSIEWKARQRFGNGQVLGVDDLLLVQSESGEITLVAMNTEKYEPLGSFQGLPADSGACWNNLCLYGDKLLLRNSQYAACWRLPTVERQFHGDSP